MPRLRRPDIEPEILVPDVSDQELRANEAIDYGYSARVRPAGYILITDGWMVITKETLRRLTYFYQKDQGLDVGLAYLMMQMCEKASSVRKRLPGGQIERRGGQEVHRLRRVGCRVYLTNKQIAARFGRSRQTVNWQIQKLKRYELIINWGRGWIEFDADLCWCGDLTLRKAYAEQQLYHPNQRAVASEPYPSANQLVGREENAQDD